MPSPSQPATDLVGHTLASRYRLTRILGAGGMGEVYAAKDQAGRHFAVKVIHRELATDELVTRFMREGMLTKSVQSPHVVQVVDVGHDKQQDLPFIVMPLLRGWDLGGLIEHTSAMDPRTAVRIARQACAGLAAAHRVGVVHRDIKPANIFVEYEDDEAVEVRLVDFGIGKRVDVDMTQLTETGRAMGSPMYMSPEQIRSTKHVDHRTDIFSLGVVLYEMLSGRPPWVDIPSVGDIMVAVCTRVPPFIQDLAPWLDPQLCLAVNQAMHKQADERFQTADSFGEQLAPFAGGADDLTRHMLVSVPDELRDVVAERARGTGASQAPTELSIDKVAAASDPLIGRTLGEKYRVVRLLGSGGMGRVYEVVGPNGVRAAAKVISSEVTGHDAQKIKRFLREAKAAQEVRGAHVARTYELGTDQQLGSPFIIMELLTGIDLAMVVRDRSPLSPEIAARIGAQAARGLAEAHASGIIHRDIKPANLFLHSPDAVGSVAVKICDFGIAKLLHDGQGAQASQDLTHTGGMLGSPMYMSPEQAKSAKTVDQRSDVWSLCITLYEALAGRRPWHEYSTLGEIIVAICTEPIPPLTSVAPWIHPALAQVVERGLERDPDKRWQSAEELASALLPYAGGTDAFRVVDVRRVDLGVAGAGAVAAVSLGEQPTAAPSVSRTLNRPVVGGGRRRAVMWSAVAAGTVVIGVGGAVAVRAMVSSRATSAESAAEVIAMPSRAEPSHLLIEPGDAIVTLNGEKVPVVAGRVTITGEPGDTFDVVVTAGTNEKRTRVVVTRDGTPSPSRIVVTAPAAVSATPAVGSAPAATPKKPPPPKVRGPVVSRPKPTPAPSPPVVAPKPVPTPAPAPATKEEWK